ncbi:MAG: zinc ribbon domain-containing protein [Nitrospirae bacterium]|nr:MAG: zinc ribbon domain-containing protein [Nitrospirota bacterium]
MALIRCKECGQEISTKAKTCPHCGSPQKRKTSPFTWLVTILIVLWAIAYFSNERTRNKLSHQLILTSIGGRLPAETSWKQTLLFTIKARETLKILRLHAPTSRKAEHGLIAIPEQYMKSSKPTPRRALIISVWGSYTARHINRHAELPI